MSYELTGQLEVKNDTQQVNERFQKREFVLRTDEERNDRTFTNYIKFQLIQDKVDLIEPYQVGESLKVSFNIKGNRWEKDGKVNFFTNLDAWRIQKADEQGGGFQNQQEDFPATGVPFQTTQETPGDTQSGGQDDDLPF